MPKSASRQAILQRVRANLQPTDNRSAARLSRAEVDQRIAANARHLIPARSALPAARQVDLFVRMAEQASASVTRVASLASVPETVAEFVVRYNYPPDVVLAGRVAELPWARVSRLRTEVRAARNGDLVCVAQALAAVAETGTLLLASGSDSPSSLNFLPDCHIVVVPISAVVGPYEDALAQVSGEPESLPRTLNFITGPSRSADIEQTLQLGAHGPIQLHIVLVEDA